MALRIVKDISRYFDIYVWDACIVGILGMLIYGCVVLFHDSKKTALLSHLREYMCSHIPQYLSCFLLDAYLYIMASIALLSRREKYIDKIDFSLFGAGLSTQMNRVFFAENIIMFLPLGVLVPICFKRARNPLTMLIIGFLSSLLIETTQFIAKWGRFEIVDLWTNTLGALLGWGIIKVIVWCCRIAQSMSKKHIQ